MYLQGFNASVLNRRSVPPLSRFYLRISFNKLKIAQLLVHVVGSKLLSRSKFQKLQISKC